MASSALVSAMLKPAVICSAAAAGSSIQAPAMFIQALPSRMVISMTWPAVSTTACMLAGGTISPFIDMAVAPVMVDSMRIGPEVMALPMAALISSTQGSANAGVAAKAAAVARKAKVMRMMGSDG